MKKTVNKKSKDQLLNELHHAYLVLNMKGIQFSIDALNELHKEHPDSQIPHSKEIESVFPSVEKALRYLDIPCEQSDAKYRDKEIYDSLHVAYKELYNRKQPFTATNYTSLVREEAYKTFPKRHHISERHGSWQNALKKVGLLAKKEQDEKEKLIVALQTADKKLNELNLRLSTKAYLELRKDNPSIYLPTIEVYRKMFGSWMDALYEANLTKRP